MHNTAFQNANKVFVGVLRTNKKLGLDKRKPKVPISKADLEKLYEEYLIPGMVAGDTEILQHKVFVDLVYYMARRGKEGLRQLQKNWFEIKTDDQGTEYVEIVVNETTKKNQGDNLSAQATWIHDENNLMFAQPGDIRCPVESFKQYNQLLNPKIQDFFQRPSKNRKSYDAMAIGKETLAGMMPVISQRANLSRRYTNHEIRKTTATGMKSGGIPEQRIAHMLKHKDMQSLSHYLAKPTIEEKRENATALYNYTRANTSKNDKAENSPQKAIEAPKEPQLPPVPQVQIIPNKENVSPENAIVPFDANLQEVQSPEPNVPISTSNQVVTNTQNNQLKQAPVLFSGATFNNCTINLNMPN